MEDFAVVQDVLLANYSPDLEPIAGSYLKFPKNKINFILGELESNYNLLLKLLELAPGDYKPVARLCCERCKSIIALCKDHRKEVKAEWDQVGDGFDIFSWMETVEKLNHTPEQFETGLAIFKPDITVIKQICSGRGTSVESHIYAYIMLLYHYLSSTNSIVLGAYFLSQVLHTFYMLEVVLFIGQEVSWPDYFSTLVNWATKCYINNTITDPLMTQEFNFKSGGAKNINPLYDFIMGGRLFSTVQLYKRLEKGPISFDAAAMGARCGVDVQDEVQILRVKAYTTHLAVVDIVRTFPNADFDFWQLLLMIVLRIPIDSATIIAKALDEYRQQVATVPAATTTAFFRVLIQEMSKYHKKAFDSATMRIRKK